MCFETSLSRQNGDIFKDGFLQCNCTLEQVNGNTVKMNRFSVLCSARDSSGAAHRLQRTAANPPHAAAAGEWDRRTETDGHCAVT